MGGVSGSGGKLEVVHVDDDTKKRNVRNPDMVRYMAGKIGKQVFGNKKQVNKKVFIHLFIHLFTYFLLIYLLVYFIYSVAFLREN